MGRQIVFYMEREQQDKLLKHAFDEGFIVLYKDFELQELIVLRENGIVKQQFYYMHFYKIEYGQVFVYEGCPNRINDSKSPVIEFSGGAIKHEEKLVQQGRLWMEPRYYAENNELLSKSPKLIKDYESFVRYVKKLVPYQEVKCGSWVRKEYITDYAKKLVEEEGYKLT